MSRSLSILAPVLFALQASGQTDSAQLTGIITDQARHAIASANIRAISAQTKDVRQATSSKTGAYSLPFLLPGSWTIDISAQGYRNASATITVAVGEHSRRDFMLVSGPSGSAQLTDPAIQSDVQELSLPLSRGDLLNLPNLTRDPYRLAQLTGNASDAGVGTRGVGLAVNGLRESSTNILFDGVENRDPFSHSVGHPYPVDSVQEFSLITSDFTAHLGRAAGAIANAAGMRGGAGLHGSAYEYNRASALTSNSFQSNANGVAEQAFARNQFGEAVGGSLMHDRLFFFENAEFTFVRSTATDYAWIPTPQLIAQSAAATQGFFQTLGQLRTGVQTLGTANLNQLAVIFGKSPCLGLVCGNLSPTLPLFTHVAYSAEGDSGGGFPQSTGNGYARFDYLLSSRIHLFGRYGIYDEHDQPGLLSTSPYANYDLTQNQLDNSGMLSAIHQWNPRWTSQTSVAFDRLTLNQQGLTSRGVVPTMYANPFASVTIGSDAVVFPGYNPYTPGVGGAFGGPQNIVQLHHDTSWSRGNHLFRFGGSYIYIRDDRTDAAYQTAVDSLSNGGGLGAALIGMLFGTFSQIQVAVNPQGQFPCGQAATCSITLPASSPNFSRSNRYHEGAFYAEDSWRFNRRLTLNLGVRWDHFGVPHNANPNLDSNWYAPGVESADSNLIKYMVLGGLQIAPKSPVGGLYKADWKDFAPRVGAAYDLFGNGSTVLRAGYGIAYDRNFDNVTFNVFQNLPNYSVLSVPGPITTNNFGPLGQTSGSISLPPPGARIIDPGLKTAYARFWSAAAERQITRNIAYTLEYSGSKGVNLYSVSYPNQDGFRNLYFGVPCLGLGDCRTRSNPYYNEDVGYRGNQGFSTYYGLNNRFLIRNFLHQGVTVSATYTWSHAVDNLSSTFFETGGQGVANRYGDRNITTNNGYFDAGLLDPFKPNLDKGDAEFDVRHRVTLAGNWSVPGWNHSRWSKRLLGGWSIAPMFTARSGQPFSVFDTVAQTLDLNTPRAVFTGSHPTRRNTFVPSTTPDTYHLITFQTSQFAHLPNLLTPTSVWPAGMSARDSFRAPGVWNFNAALYKDAKLSDRFALQLRAEFFNVFNHANLYVIGTSANVGVENTIDACFGCTGSSYDRRQVQLAARFAF